MTSPSARHVGCANLATTYFSEAFGRRAIVSIQNPMLLNLYNDPQSESRLAFDRKAKLPRYAACGTPEVWIEDLKHGLLLVFRDLENSVYKTSLALRRGDLLG